MLTSLSFLLASGTPINGPQDDCQAFETILVYLEQQPHVPINATVLINGLYMEAVKKRYETQKQTVIILHALQT